VSDTNQNIKYTVLPLGGIAAAADGGNYSYETK
jgi:hypothetical protein